MSERYSGMDFDTSSLPLLSRTLAGAETLEPQPIRDSLEPAIRNQHQCAAAGMDDLVMADKTTCRYIAAAGTASCRSFFLRNPKTSASVIAHMSSGIDETRFLESISRIAKRGDTLDLYIMGGDGFRDYLENGNMLYYDPNADPETAQEVEESLANLFQHTVPAGIGINPRVVNLYSNKPTYNAVLDLQNGEFFYVSDETIKSHLLRNEEHDPPNNAPLQIVCDSLKKGLSR